MIREPKHQVNEHRIVRKIPVIPVIAKSLTTGKKQSAWLEPVDVEQRFVGYYFEDLFLWEMWEDVFIIGPADEKKEIQMYILKGIGYSLLLTLLIGSIIVAVGSKEIIKLDHPLVMIGMLMFLAAIPGFSFGMGISERVDKDEDH